MTTQRNDALKKDFILDRYKIESVLGDGGFGITYLATHIQGEWTVAIKEYLPSMLALRNSNEVTIAPRSSNDAQTYQDSLQQFLNEAKILSRFTEHPNIVTVRDFFEANGTAYLVMNYELGQTLDKWLLQNPQPAQEQLLQIFLPILDGLRELHAQDHLHRDIKPENIYIRSDGRPMLIDFGAARDKIGRNRSHTVRAVSDGFSPYEQYDSKSIIGAWSDIYAIGATMWAMVNNGVEPVSALDRGTAIINEEPDPLISAIDIAKDHYSQGFLKLIDWALMFQPKKRPHSVQKLQGEFLLEEQVKKGLDVLLIPEKDDDAIWLTDSALPVGYIINDKYCITRVLGKGAFGIAYQATNILLEKQVVIKEYYPYGSTRHVTTGKVKTKNESDSCLFDEQKNQFIYVAKILSQFSHPNIRLILDVFEYNETVYQVFSYEKVQAFDDWIDNSQLSQDQLLKGILPMLDGLILIHGKNYLHGEICPSKIFVKSDNSLMLFEAGTVILIDRTPTMVLVCDGYSPSEQYKLGKLGRSADIYAIGACLWRAISGKKPPSAIDRDNAQKAGELDPLISAKAMFRGEYSDNFLETIDWALELHSKNRPQTVMEFRDKLLIDEKVFEKHDLTKLNREYKDNISYNSISSKNLLTKINTGSSQLLGAQECQKDYLASDNFGDVSIFSVADGMGEEGDLASVTAVKAFFDFVLCRWGTYFERDAIPDLLIDGVYQANSILAGVKQDSESHMGTTLVALIAYKNHAWWVSVGDSLLYLLRDGKLQKLNAEHSHYHDLRQKVFLGEISNGQAENDPECEGLTSALMGRILKYVDISRFGIDLQVGDRFLLASDGLDTLSFDFIASTLQQQDIEPQKITELLVKQIKQINNLHQDNVSILMVDIQKADIRELSLIDKLKWKLKGKA